MIDSEDFATAAQALAALDHLGVHELEVLYRQERTSAHLYELLADQIDSAPAADLLRRNAREELGHARRASRAITIKLGRDHEPSALQEQCYALDLPPIPIVDLLTAIAAGEQAGEADYRRWAEGEPDPDVAQLLRRNGREETRHSERVAQVIEMIQAGELTSS